MKKYKKIIKISFSLVLITIIISMIFINLNNKNKGIEKELASKEQLTTTSSDNGYVSMSDHSREVSEAYANGFNDGLNTINEGDTLNFSYTGDVKKYVVPVSGTYTITAVGGARRSITRWYYKGRYTKH